MHLEIQRPQRANFLTTGRYLLVFGRPSNYTVLAQSSSLYEISKHRRVSGDLVVEVFHQHLLPTNANRLTFQAQVEVNKDWIWLFDWERDQPGCYARQAQEHGWRW